MRDGHDAVPALAIPAIASAGAAVLHAAAAGVHADHRGLARIFIVLALLQAAVAVAGLLGGRGRVVAIALVAVNIGAVAGWLTTRLVGIEWIGGLETASRPEIADTIAALLAAVAVLGTVAAVSDVRRAIQVKPVVSAAVLTGVLVVPGLVDATDHTHPDDGHDHAVATGAIAAHEHQHDTPQLAAAPSGGVPAADEDDPAFTTASVTTASITTAPVTTGAGEANADPVDATWPRPWDPAEPIDFSGVPGVSEEQRERAEQLVVDTLRDLPAFADVTAVGALGYQSIGDEASGFEHYVNYRLIFDGKILDPSAPESLVYRVDGDNRTLVSAMFIADTPIDDPELVGFGGPLMQWHVHLNLCWGVDEQGQPTIRHVLTQPGETCPAGTVNAGGENPMVHVWIVPHECGPFAALEGHGAGHVDPSTGRRVDQCDHAHPAG